MLDTVVWPVRTQRLSIRPADAVDVDATWRFRRLESVSHWISAAPSTREEYATRFLDRLESTLVFELGGTVIGDLMLKREDGWSQAEVADQARGVQAELGWCLDPAHEGHGFATEAVAELIRVSFEDLGLRRLVAGTFVDNEASWMLMERVGMRREAHSVRESLHRTLGWLDAFEYALLADEWRSGT